jgi:hypothetical protein
VQRLTQKLNIITNIKAIHNKYQNYIYILFSELLDGEIHKTEQNRRQKIFFLPLLRVIKKETSIQEGKIKETKIITWHRVIYLHM